MLEFQEVTLSRDNKTFIEELSLQIPDGSVYGIFGMDHEARSMLVRSAAGTFPPDSGRILADEEDVYAPDSESYRFIGFMGQKPSYYDKLKVEEFYDLILTMYQVAGRNRRVRMEEVLELVGLAEFRDAYIEQLAHDQLPFMSLGTAVLHEPAWLILDEPFEMINGDARDRMVNILAYLCESGISILINSQMYPELYGFLTDLAVIEDGRNTINGSIEDVFEEITNKSPVSMHVLDKMENALAILKLNPLVERVTVVDQDVLFRFTGDEREEAQLLTQLVASGALIQNYNRDRMNLDDILRG